jgi:DNA-binding LacI/PurR family transcriptional regulator
MGALDAARWELGIRVPQDLSIIGFDDIPMASWPGYSLSTVRQPVERMVEATVQVLMDAIEDPEAEARIRIISPSLVQRTSARVNDS